VVAGTVLGSLYNAINSQRLDLHSRGWIAAAIYISAIVIVAISGEYESREGWQALDWVSLVAFSAVLVLVSASLAAHYKKS